MDTKGRGASRRMIMKRRYRVERIDDIGEWCVLEVSGEDSGDKSDKGKADTPASKMTSYGGALVRERAR